MPKVLNLEEARKAGIPDSEIISFLAGKHKFNLDAARKVMKEGKRVFSEEKILSTLMEKDLEWSKDIDRSTGVDYGTRMLLGDMPMNDQLKTMENRYPDSKPKIEPKSIMLGNETDNISFTHPETGERTMVNPSGFDIGDLMQKHRPLAKAVGQATGAGLGATAGLATPIPGDEAPMAYMFQSLLGEATGLADDALMELYGRIDKRKFHQRLVDSAKDILIDAGIGKASDNLIDAGKQIVNKGINRLSPATQESKTLYNDFINTEIEPTAGAVTGNKSIQRLEEWLEGSLTGHKNIHNKAVKSFDDTANATNALATKFGKVSDVQTLGTKVLKPSAKKAVEAYEKNVETLENKVAEMVGAKTPISTEETEKALQKIIDKFEGAEKTGAGINQTFIKMLDRLKADKKTSILNPSEAREIPYDAIRGLRTNVRGLIEKADSDTAGKLKQVHAALTRDLRKGAANKSPEALKTFDSAMAYQRHMAEKELPTLRKMLREDRPDESIYKYAMSGSKDGNSRLRILRKNSTKEQWGEMAGTTLYRMGLAKPGAQKIGTDILEEGTTFSVNTFLTSWNKLSSGAKRTLFSGGKFEKLRPELDRLVKIIGKQKEVEGVKNTSRTSVFNQISNLFLAPVGAGAAGALSGGAGTGIAATLGTVGAMTIPPKVAAKLITNPKFVRWLAQGSKLIERNPASIKTHIPRLMAIAAKEDADVKKSVLEYKKYLETQFGKDKQEKLEAR